MNDEDEDEEEEEEEEGRGKEEKEKKEKKKKEERGLATSKRRSKGRRQLDASLSLARSNTKTSWMTSDLSVRLDQPETLFAVATRSMNSFKDIRQCRDSSSIALKIDITSRCRWLTVAAPPLGSRGRWESSVFDP
ncbi:hypothetical protein HZH68_015664 [Vespula germanica]|uniref:Uncharacterized protein n=1 Tax=Vespula germanica TaxID=30212 RepID=A0A834J639_VESGE|nr:hypothetical protein HZH68_015664 [Vespula germanica]